LLQWAGVTLPVRVTGSPLEARYLESGTDALLFLFNHGRERAKADVWLRRDPGDYTASDVVDGGPVTLVRSGDGVTVAVDLRTEGVRVLRIARR
jgi:hypothetical protein